MYSEFFLDCIKTSKLEAALYWQIWGQQKLDWHTRDTQQYSTSNTGQGNNALAEVTGRTRKNFKG